MTGAGRRARRSSSKPGAQRPASAPVRGQAGQAAVELALVLPVLAVALLAVVQVGVVARDHLLVVHAAREGARAAAVDPAAGAAGIAAISASGLMHDRLTVDSAAGPSSDVVVVSVRYRAPTTVPVVGALVPDVLLGAKAAMRIEW